MRTLVLALLVICCFAAYTVEGVGSEVLGRSMCVALTTKPLHFKQISKYTIDEGPLKAVIFITKRGIKICANPDHKWVKNAVKYVHRSAKKTVIRTSPTRAQQATMTAFKTTTATSVTLTG
ncbi:lymphotactin-like [Talpa occidentalis]|uniref:lymphotactin-like n=1 Tax=Talpa occidentalis TaxID=50954 RepID=UPI00188F8B91|nr:lymphotactin-like [Talpa occidentalis]